MMRDNAKMIAVGRATPIFAKSQIQVYSPAGSGLLLFGARNTYHYLIVYLSLPYSVGTSENYQIRLDWGRKARGAE